MSANRESIDLLLVEDNPGDAALVRGAVAASGAAEFHVTEASRLADALEAVESGSFRIVLLDLSLPDARGLRTLERMRDAAPNLPIVVMTGLDDEETAVKAVQIGAQDYLVKGQLDDRSLVRTLRYAMERQRMIVELDVARERERFLATHDALTGLPNRQLFFDRLSQAVAYAGRYDHWLAVLFLDLDGFKEVNDTLGHAAADEVLRAVATRLGGSVRRSDTVARLGGDEFAVVLSRILRTRDAARVAEKIVALLAEPHDLGGQQVYLTSSVGIAVYPCDGANPDTLVKNADAAMYSAKKGGKNRYQFYTFGMNTTAYRHLRMERDLHEAIRREELELRFDPWVDAVTGEIVGVKAVPDWHHPEFGPVDPAELTRLTGEAGLGAEIGEWVLRTAAERAAQWRRAGHRLEILSVDLPPRQVQNASFSRTVSLATESSGIDPSLVELDVAESVLRHGDPDELRAALERIEATGVRLALDDVGEGPSVASSLESLPVSALKIGSSLVRDILGESTHASVAAALVTLAENVRVEVGALGVAMPEQARFLAENGCRRLRGPLFGQGLSEEEMEEALRAGVEEPKRAAGGAGA